jgi:hypothetical protein
MFFLKNGHSLFELLYPVIPFDQIRSGLSFGT